MEKGQRFSKYDTKNVNHNTLKRMDLTSIRYAITVNEFSNFRHAANYLGVSQSSVSTRVKSLEDQLGIALFERRHRGVRVTEAGRRFIDEVSAGLIHFEIAFQTAGSIAQGTSGQLSIGIHSTISAGILPVLRKKFKSLYPLVKETIYEGKAEDVISLVREGRVDISFIVGAFDIPDCHSKNLWTEEYRIALSTDNNLAVNGEIRWVDLTRQNFIFRHGGAGPQLQDHVVRRFAEKEKSPRIYRSDIGRDTMMQMIADNDGVTLVTETIARIQSPGVTFLPIADETEECRFSIVWSPHNSSAALRNFLSLANDLSNTGMSA